MRVSLAQQFVVATVTLTLAVLVATLLLARWSFERGFTEYVRELERKRLAQVGAALLASYDEETGWAGLRRRTFDGALRVLPVIRELRPQPGLQSGAGPRPQRGRRRPDGPPPRERAMSTALFDAGGELVMGHRYGTQGAGKEILRYPLQWQGQVVGELRSMPRRRLESPQETAFAQQQRRASLLIFASAMVLAVLMAMLLARRLLAPLRRAHGALATIADGEYGQRLESRRQDELGQLMGDIDSLATTLEENQSARRRWIADISHELRTPVTVLKGELEAIADGVRPFDQHQLASLQAEVARIGKLIDDLYQLSLADLGGLRYEFGPVDLAELVRAMGAACAPLMEREGLQFSVHVGGPCSVRGDKRRLEQLMRNLLENSRAYTDPPGFVRVRLETESSESGENIVALVVEDSAPGVPKQACEALFDPLYRREESRDRRSAGAGLGLAIARAVVVAHGGTISATPSTLGGLAVRVSFPAAGAPTSGGSSSP